MNTVLVTGGTRRLGAAVATHLKGLGWRVVTQSSRSDAGADFVADFREPLAAARLFSAVCEQYPDLCAIVNNAGLFTGEATALEAVNHVAPEKLTTLLGLRLMEHAPFAGCVVNILDTRVLGGAAEGGPYESSKRALLDFTRKAAGLFAPHLRVNAVAPGPVLPPEGVHEKAEAAGELLLERRPTPEDVAQAVAYLLSAASVTGTVIPVDAGQWLGAYNA